MSNNQNISDLRKRREQIVRKIEKLKSIKSEVIGKNTYYDNEINRILNKKSKELHEKRIENIDKKVSDLTKKLRKINRKISELESKPKINKNEKKNKELQYLIISLALIGIIGVFLLTEPFKQGPTGYVLSRGAINATFYNVNEKIGGNVSIEIRLGDHLPNATNVNVSFEGNMNITFLEDFIKTSGYACDVNSSTTLFSDIDAVRGWEGISGYGYSYNESSDCAAVQHNLTIDLSRLFPGDLTAPSTQGYYPLILNATYEATNEGVVFSQTDIQVGQNPNNPSGVLFNSTISDQTNLTNETLSANFLCDDPDTSDTLTYDITFYLNGVANFIQAGIGCSDPQYVSHNLNFGNTTKNDLWSFTVNVSSGNLNSSTIFSNNVTIENAVPATPPLNAPENNTLMPLDSLIFQLNWSNVSDLDIDGDVYTYYLEVWNESGATNIMYVNSSISETANTTGDVVIFSNETKDYFWRVLANDGTANSSFSDLRNISIQVTPDNNPPNDPTNLIFNSTLAVQTNLTTEDLSANFLCDDPDVSDTLTYDITFYLGGVANFSETNIPCSDPEYIGHILNSANTSKSELWSFSINVSDDSATSLNTIFSNNVTIENSFPIINFVSLNGTITPAAGGIRQFIFSFIASDDDGVGDLDASTAIANVSLSTESASNSSCSDEGSVIGGRNYSCTIPIEYYFNSGSWNYGTEIKDTDGISVQNTTGTSGEEQTWVYSELVAFNLTSSSIAWTTVVPLNTNETSATNPLSVENIGNKAALDLRTSAIDLAGPSNTIIPAGNFSIGNMTSAASIECDFTNQTTTVTTGVLPLIFINNTNIFPLTNALARGQGSSENLYYCLFDVPSDLVSGTYNTDAGGSWDITAL